MRSIASLCVLLLASVSFSQNASQKDVDIVAPDGAKLRAAFFSADKSGPGVLLLHMCNTTRKSWEPVAAALAKKPPLGKGMKNSTASTWTSPLSGRDIDPSGRSAGRAARRL